MKIGIIIEHEPSEGGAFYQAVASTQQFISAGSQLFDIEVYTFNKKSYTELISFGIKSKIIQYNFIDLIRGKIINLFKTLFGIIISNTLLEKKLILKSIDLVYFLSPSYLATDFKSLNYISTVFDLCHVDFPEFPEIRDSNEYYFRDNLFRHVLPRSALVIVNDESLKLRVKNLYGINEFRIVNIPFDIIDLPERLQIVNKVALPERYLFYPAQFWMHKNHRRILEVVKILSDMSLEFNVIFVGSDRSNNIETLKKYSNELGISNLVQFEGFVSKNEMQILYKNAFALIMPSYFGPTNLPPLESWSNKCPVIYNKWFKDQTTDAALYVDPDDANSFIEPILKLIDPIFREDLINKGLLRLRENRTNRQIGVEKMISKLKNHESRVFNK